METYRIKEYPDDLAKKLAQKFESEIKQAIVLKFSVDSDELDLLLADQDGVYFSEEEPDVLCCLVVGNKNGFFYLVTAKMKEDGESLIDFKSSTVS